MMTAHESQRLRSFDGEGLLDRGAGDVVAFALGEDGHAASAKIDDQIGVVAADAAGALGLGAQRAANLDDEIFPLGVAHRFPVALQQRGLLQLAGGDLVAAFVDQFLQLRF